MQNTLALGTLDAKLRWKAHVKKKRDQLGIKYKKNVLAAWKKLHSVSA